jgi:hypothetical protein
MESFTSMYDSGVVSLVGEYLVLERYQSVNILLLPFELKEMLEPSTSTWCIILHHKSCPNSSWNDQDTIFGREGVMCLMIEVKPIFVLVLKDSDLALLWMKFKEVL